MNIEDLKKLSLQELEEVIRAANKLIEKKKKETVKTTLDAVRRLAESRGLNLDDIIAAHTASGAAGEQATSDKRTMKPKYQDPDRPEDTWAGRGKLPNWLVARMAEGKTKEDFLIKD